MFTMVKLMVAALLLTAAAGAKPNIVLIMSDDQDRLLNSLDYMPIVQREMVAKGTYFVNHFATVSNCCPSRASLLRGQMAHNNNITHVRAPGGNYDKWIASGEDNDYLPQWIKKAGYRAEYIGKFLNGHNTVNWVTSPKGWDHIDALLDPYTGNYNNVVMSKNGERPVSYHGFHQTDVVRTKGLARLQYLLDSDKPFYLAISPYAPHVQGDLPPVPCSRHNSSFLDLKAPRFDNWNPPDEIQRQKSVWMKELPLMNDSWLQAADNLYRGRIQALQGVDEIVEDVIDMLERNDALENTYVIYTTDNGYHIGAYRLPGGKALPYHSDTNLPLIVRGPGIPANHTSKTASAHLDFAPTFLDIMGMSEEERPPFLDGRSLLSEWTKQPNETTANIGCKQGPKHDVMNIEFWGDKVIEVPGSTTLLKNTSYKTLRMVNEENSWLYVHWCTNEIELYNTTADPWELHNLARTTPLRESTQRVLSRLNAILLVTKSCEGPTCRNPWSVLQPPSAPRDHSISTLAEALDPSYDAFFNSLPSIHFKECMYYQDEENEQPFYPSGAENGLGKAYRRSTANFVTTVPNGTAVPGNDVLEGSVQQRYVTLEDIVEQSRELTDEELGFSGVGGDALAGNPVMMD